MTPEHAEELRQVAPSVYDGAAFGFECGDGWFGLLRDLSTALEALPADERPRATQVKEKFGQLRFYVSRGSGKIRELIAEAERRSNVTCEECGEPGKARCAGGWWKTVCEKCDREPRRTT